MEQTGVFLFNPGPRISSKEQSIMNNSNENICRLFREEKEIILIGTAHFSEESASLVEKTIKQESPDTVCLEICQSRFMSLTQKRKWQNMDLLKVIREKKAFLLLANLALAYFQKRMGRRLGIRPGEEILRAKSTAEDVGANIHLTDRDIRTTLARTWHAMGMWTKARLLVRLVFSSGETESVTREEIERLKKEDVLESVLSEIGQSFPEIRRVLIDERDQYIAHKIRNAPGGRIVAVVGAGHVPGIKKYWEKPVDLQSLEQMPSGSKAIKVMKWAVPICILALILLGFFGLGADAGSSMLKWWILANALFAGLGAAVALAHPLTVLTAVVSSPLTSLNPMVAAGWLSGLVETLLGRPKVRDFENLPQDISTVKGFWKNKITRVLMVVVFTNLGSALGAFVAIPFMIRIFA